MQTKLTLRLESELIEKVKTLAEDLDISLSKMVTDYFNSLLQINNLPDPSSPLLDEIMGMLPNKNYKNDYRDYLDNKYS